MSEDTAFDPGGQEGPCLMRICDAVLESRSARSVNKRGCVAAASGTGSIGLWTRSEDMGIETPVITKG